MPSSIVKSFAKKSGKSIDEVEALWDKAIDLTTKRGLSSSSSSFYAYAVGILKKMLKVELNYLSDDPRLLLDGYMDGTPHRIRQTPINSTSKIFKRDSFLKDREERDKKSKKNKKKANNRPTLNQVNSISRLKPMDIYRDGQ